MTKLRKKATWAPRLKLKTQRSGRSHRNACGRGLALGSRLAAPSTSNKAAPGSRSTPAMRGPLASYRRVFCWEVKGHVMPPRGRICDA